MTMLKSKYFFLFLSLLGYLLVSPFLVGTQFSDFIISVLFSFIVIFCVNTITRDRKLLFASIVLGGTSLITYWSMNLGIAPEWVYELHNVVYIIFLIAMIYYVTMSVSQHPKITKETLLGAISGYILLGITWAYIYLLLNDFNPHAFSDHANTGTLRDRIQHFIYFSFETLTTLGLGDVLPLSDVARTFTWLEAVAGQIYLAVWISQLVGLRIAQLVTMQSKQG